MKKYISFILAVLFAVPVFAGSVSDIDKDAYIRHTTEMQSLRRQILKLTVKQDKTQQEQAILNELSKEFDKKSEQWQSYLERVAEQGNEAELPSQMKIPPQFDEINKARMEDEMRAKMGGKLCLKAPKHHMKHHKKDGHKHVCSVCGKDFSAIAHERRAKKMEKMHKHHMHPMKPCVCGMPKCEKDGKPMMPPPCFKDGKPMMPKFCPECKDLNAAKVCEQCKGMKLDICKDCKGVKAPSFCDKCKAQMTSPVPPMPLMPTMRPCVCNMPKGHMHPMMPKCDKDGKPMMPPPCFMKGPKPDFKAACASCCKNDCAKCCKDDCKACCGKKAIEAMKKVAHKMACMACCKDDCAKCCKDNCKECCDKKAMNGCKASKDCKAAKECKSDKDCKK